MRTIRHVALYLSVAAAVLGFGRASCAQNWSGLQIGIQGTGAWGTSRGDLMHPGQVPYSFSAWGGFGGGHIGYDWRFGPWLAGVEADAEGGSFSGFQDPAPRIAVDNRLYFDGSARLRFGVATPSLLFYGTGGLAFGDVDTRYSVGGLSWFPAESLRAGWTVGAGVAYALAPHWETGIEYRFTDLGAHSVGNPVFADTNRFQFNAIRLNLTYRFSSFP